MRYSILIIAFLMFNFTGYSQTTSGQEDRAYWVNMLSQIADPLLNNMSKGELKKSRYDDHESKIRLNSFTGNHLLGL